MNDEVKNERFDSGIFPIFSPNEMTEIEIKYVSFPSFFFDYVIFFRDQSSVQLIDGCSLKW